MSLKREKKSSYINTAGWYTGIDIHTHTHTHTHAHTHTHTHTHACTYTQVCRHKHYTDCWGKGQWYSVEMLWEEECLEFVFEGRERIRVSDILGEVVPDMRTEIGERAKAMSFAVLLVLGLVGLHWCYSFWADIAWILLTRRCNSTNSQIMSKCYLVLWGGRWQWCYRLRAGVCPDWRLLTLSLLAFLQMSRCQSRLEATGNCHYWLFFTDYEQASALIIDYWYCHYCFFYRLWADAGLDERLLTLSLLAFLQIMSGCQPLSEVTTLW